jgi:Ca-activated chloride channel family protein
VKARGLVIVLAIAAVVAAVVVSRGGGDGGGGGGDKPSGDSLKISFAYSPEKQKLLEPLIRKFNRRGEEVDGKPVFVEGQVVSSGESETRIARGQLKPVLWSPASSLWGRLLNYETDRDYVARDNPSLVRTPLVIAMWEPLARALGYPRKPLGFEQVLALAVDRRGWAAYGKPQFGRFKLGHTNPDFSTSGLSAVAAEYYAATGKREGLTLQDVARADVRRKIQQIEASIVHYGDTTVFFAEQLRRYGPAYASAVALEETTLVEFNEQRRGGLKLVAIYPHEGTFHSDNPLITLQAPWVSDGQRDAAGKFKEFLKDEVDPSLAARYGFRPPGGGRPRAPIDAAHGADPAQPTRTLSLPDPRVLARVKAQWREDRKPANVMLVVDTSGSMSEENRLEQAKQGLRAFFGQLSPRDRVGLTAFNDRIDPLVPVAPFASNRARLEQAVAELFPDGQTAVYDATQAGLQAVQRLNDSSRINAVVVLTDGEDNRSSLTVDRLRAELDRQARSETQGIRVYTIAYGGQANRGALDGLAAASGGKGYGGDPAQIEGVYRSISSFF